LVVLIRGLLSASLLVVAVGAQRADAPDTRIVRVTAERFAFTPSEITVTAGTSIEFQIKSADTAHGFRIIGQNIDLTIPKRGRGDANVTFTPPEPGTYVFECSRMCGAGHSFMRGTIRVRPNPLRAADASSEGADTRAKGRR
jgi:cytochrome c oxidase subunit 2